MNFVFNAIVFLGASLVYGILLLKYCIEILYNLFVGEEEEEEEKK